MTFLAALLPGILQFGASKPWQSSPENDQAPIVQGPDTTTLIIVGLVSVAIIVMLIIFLNKKK
jgi:hypothetical protein